MTQEIIAKFFTFTDANGTLQITYYPLARLEYQKPDWQGSLPDEPQVAFKAIADEIIKMSEVDQQMRKSGKWDSSREYHKR